MNSMNPRRAAALGTLICALGATDAASSHRLRAAASSPRQDLATFDSPLKTVSPTEAQNQDPTIRAVKVTASRYRFEPAVIEVFQDDVVKIDLGTDDIAHSMTIDAYRIAKRVSPSHPVTFEFRADRAGTFPYYCDLQIDDGCRQMRGQLVVKVRK